MDSNEEQVLWKPAKDQVIHPCRWTRIVIARG